MIYAFLIAFIGIIMLVNSFVIVETDIDIKRSWSEAEGAFGIAITVLSLLAVAYLCGMDYARSHRAEPQEKAIETSEVSDD